jgi:peptidoglycan/LPS O-acetylase OafA/YrhL
MLGLFRYFLALGVAYGHLTNELIWMSTAYSVFCFYLVSGYLMSLVLNEVYIGSENTFRYLANRALRIYPPYIVVLIVTTVTVSLVPALMDIALSGLLTLGHAVRLPSSGQQWFANISLLYQPAEGLAVSQAWSLHVELVYYVAMIFLVRHKSRVFLWCVLSVAYAAYLQYIDASFFERYSTILGASIAFSFGAVVYQLQKKYRLSALHLPIAATLFFLHVAFAERIWGNSTEGFAKGFYPETYGIYANLILAAYLLYAMVCVQEPQGKFFRFGKTLGDIAYAIFLVHWVVAIWIISAGVSLDNAQLFLPIHFVALNVVAIALYLLVEKPVNIHFRDKIRKL